MNADEERKGRELSIPAEWESLFVGPEAATEEVQAVVFEVRAEFVAFLRTRQVRDDYVAELGQVLPGQVSRMFYEGDNEPDADPTVTEPFVTSENPLVQDYSRLQLVWCGRAS
jgi:hypothetical protein